MNDRIHRVRIDSFALDGLLEAHRGAADSEPCGVLIGRASAAGIDLVACWPLPNAHTNPSRAFLLPPDEVAAAQGRARERGLDVVGTWHGHPRGPARLSGADVAGLAAASVGPGEGGVPATRPHAFLVTGAGAGRAVVARAFVQAGRGATEVPLKLLPAT
jgi:desampylase